MGCRQKYIRKIHFEIEGIKMHRGLINFSSLRVHRRASLAHRQRVRFPPGLLKPFCLPCIPSAEAAEPLAAPKTSIVNQPRVINDFRHGSSAQPCLHGRKENCEFDQEKESAEEGTTGNNQKWTVLHFHTAEMHVDAE